MTEKIPQANFQRRRKKEVFKSTPGDEQQVHWTEAEYEEIAPNTWQLVYGSEKDLGLVEEKDKKKE